MVDKPAPQNSWSLAFDPGAGGVALAMWALTQASNIARKTPAGRAFTLGQALAKHLARRGLMRGMVPTYGKTDITMPPGWTRTKLCGGPETYTVNGAVSGTCGQQPYNLPGTSFPPAISAPFYSLSYQSDFIPGQIIARRSWQYGRVLGAPLFSSGYAPGVPVHFQPSRITDYPDPTRIPEEMPAYDPWKAPLPLMPPDPFPPEAPPYHETPELPQTGPDGKPLRGPSDNPRPYQPWPDSPPHYDPWPAPHENPGPGPDPAPQPRPGGPGAPDLPLPVGTPDEEIDWTWEPELPDKKKKPDREDPGVDPVTQPPPGTAAPPDRDKLKLWERETDWRVTFEPKADPRWDREPHKNLPPVRGKEKEIKLYMRLQVPIVKALGRITEGCDAIDALFKALPDEIRQEVDSTEFLRKTRPGLGELVDQAVKGNWGHYKTGIQDKRPKGKAWHDARRRFNERNKRMPPGMRSEWGKKATCQAKYWAVDSNLDKLANQAAMAEALKNLLLNEVEDRSIGKLGKGAAKFNRQQGFGLGLQGRGL